MIKISDKFVDEKNISAMELYSFNSDKDYSVQIFGKFGQIYNLNFKSKVEAEKFMEELSKRIDTEEKEQKDYIQGFKDGVEYALKIKD